MATGCATHAWRSAATSGVSRPLGRCQCPSGDCQIQKYGCQLRLVQVLPSRLVSRSEPVGRIPPVKGNAVRITLLVALLLSTLAVEVGAQQLSVGFAGYAPFGVEDLDGTLPPAAELRFSLPVTDRFAIEPFVNIGGTRVGGRRYAEGLWGVQVRQRIVRSTQHDSFAFTTYGAAGAYSAGGVIPPVLGLFGLGLHVPLTRFLSFRPEAQLLTVHVVPIGGRLVAGFAVGHWRR